MSGGSYDYLCFAELEDLFNRKGHLSNMTDRLMELGYPQLALENMEFALDLRRFKLNFGTRQKRLREIWHTIEWLDSGDYGVDTARKHLDKLLEEE